LIRIFFLKLSAIVLPIALLVVFTNYYIDPANLFSSKQYVSGIADILAKGHNVNNIANYDERLFQEQMITKIGYKPDIVILGSSRIMEIGTDFFTNKKVLNCGVSHGNINDVVAIMGVLDSVGKLPKKVIINVDPFLICKGGSIEWQTLYAYYTSLINKIDINNKKIARVQSDKFYSLISFDYFEKSLKFKIDGNNKKYEDAGQQKPSKYGRYSDGSICYPDSYTHADTIKVSLDAKDAAIRDQTEFDTSRLVLLNNLLDFLNKNKVDAEFVMLPFQHEYYTIRSQLTENALEFYKNIFIELGKKRNINIIGDFDPLKTGVTKSQFYDTYHCSREAIKKIFTTPIL